MKSSNTTCLWVRMPWRCHASPYSPPANVGNGKHTTHFQPRDAGGVEGRQAGQPEPAVSIQQHGIVAIELEPLAVGEQHRDACAVLSGVEHLPLLEGVRVEGD